VVAWKHAVGESLSAHAVVTKLHESTLIVAVRDTIWQQQLNIMKRQLIGRVNFVLGQPLIKDIQLQIDQTLFKTRESVPEKVEETSEMELPLELWSAARNIQDDQLRQKFLRTALADLRRKQRDANRRI
jgi:hypothetical protein